MAITFDDLRLLIIPKVKSCPPQIINQRLAWASRRFLNRSEVWRHTQNQNVVADLNSYLLGLPTLAPNAEIKRLRAGWYGSSSEEKSIEDRIGDDQYDYRVNKLRVTVADAGGADPDPSGTYEDSGKTYNSQPLYKYAIDDYLLWWDGSQWRISEEIGDTDYYLGEDGTIAGNYTAQGSWSGSLTVTDASGQAIDFINAYTSALDYGLTTEIVLMPDLAYTSEIPDELMDEWGVRGFMELCIWDLKNDKNQPWEDIPGSRHNKVMADRAIAEARRQTFTQRKAGDLRVIPRYFA